MRSRGFDARHLARFLKRFGVGNTARAIASELGDHDFVIRTGGHTFRSNRDTFAFFHLVESWPKLERLVARLPAEPLFVLDVGANLGVFSSFVERHGEAEIHAFEPSPVAVRYLRQNVSSRVVINEMCVGDVDGELTFYDVSESLQLGTAVAAEAARRDSRPRQVPCTRLDTYLRKLGARSAFSVLKVDVQGYEAAVLRGLGDELARFDMIFAESSWMERTSVEAGLQLTGRALHWEVINAVYWGADLCCYMTPRALAHAPRA